MKDKRKLKIILKLLNKYLVGSINAEFDFNLDNVLFYWIVSDTVYITRVRIDVFESSPSLFLVDLVVKQLFHVMRSTRKVSDLL